MREREETKLARAYSQKAEETRIVVGNQHEQEMEKKLMYKRELKDKMQASLFFEKNRLDLDH